jgi:WD40 repeat protein
VRIFASKTSNRNGFYVNYIINLSIAYANYNISFYNLGAGDETLRFWNVFSKARSQKENKSVLNLFTNIR